MLLATLGPWSGLGDSELKDCSGQTDPGTLYFQRGDSICTWMGPLAHMGPPGRTAHQLNSASEQSESYKD